AEQLSKPMTNTALLIESGDQTVSQTGYPPAWHQMLQMLLLQLCFLDKPLRSQCNLRFQLCPNRLWKARNYHNCRQQLPGRKTAYFSELSSGKAYGSQRSAGIALDVIYGTRAKALNRRHQKESR